LIKGYNHSKRNLNFLTLTLVGEVEAAAAGICTETQPNAAARRRWYLVDH